MCRMQLLMLLLAMTVGCNRTGPDQKPVSPATPPKADVAAPVVAPETKGLVAEIPPVAAAEPWGSVKGQIIWGGDKPPARESVKVPENHQDHKFCTKDGEIHHETWVIDAKSKGVKNTFVWLQPADKEGKLAVHPSWQKVADADKKVVMDQPVCMFVPHALAVREGQTLVAKNSSKVLHNFNWSGDGVVNVGANKSMTPGSEQEIELKAHRTPITVSCQFHPWMKAWIRVFDHPYYAVTDDQGRFEIKDAPAGPCRLMIWHGSSGWLGGREGRDGKAITIPSGKNDLGSLVFPPPPE